VLSTSSLGDSASDYALGYGAALGYDFNSRPSGFGLVLEARYNWLTIDDESAGGCTLTLNLCWK